jgi:hypothetical protein
MKKIFGFGFLLLALPLWASADTIVFKDGMRLDSPKVWEQNGEVQCEIGGIVFGYPKADVERIEKGGRGGRTGEASMLKVHKEVPVAARKKAAVLRKDQAVPKKEAAMPGEKPLAPKRTAAVSKKESASPEKKTAAPKKATAIPEKAATAPEGENAKKEAAAEYAEIPSFKEIINEDDRNPPVFIKLRRVLLVSRGLAKARIKALLLSYEKKLRTELNARKARNKMIVVWVYDDFVSADEGAAGWVGMISNGHYTGRLSDDPELLVPES